VKRRRRRRSKEKRKREKRKRGKEEKRKRGKEGKRERGKEEEKEEEKKKEEKKKRGREYQRGIMGIMDNGINVAKGNVHDYNSLRYCGIHPSCSIRPRVVSPRVACPVLLMTTGLR